MTYTLALGVWMPAPHLGIGSWSTMSDAPPAPSALPIIVIENDAPTSGATGVSICSNALQLLGHKPFSSFDEDDVNAALCANVYPTVRNATLRAHPWTSCTKRVVLAPDSVGPVFGFGQAFSLPGDCTRVLSVEPCLSSGSFYGAGAAWRSRGQDDYAIEGRKLFANGKTVLLRYVFLNLIEASYDDLLVNALTLAMAMRLCYAVTASTSLYQMLAQDYAGALKTARSVNGQELPDATFGDFPLLASRYR